jgi:hypothetical protein
LPGPTRRFTTNRRRNQDPEEIRVMSSQISRRLVYHPAISLAPAARTSTGRALVALLVVVSGVSGCAEVDKNTNDLTPPQIEIKVKGANGQYAPASTTSLSLANIGQVDWMCIISDAEGVRSGMITYTSLVHSCHFAGLDTACLVPYQPQPQSLFQEYGGNANGQVPDTLPLLATVKGPVTCSCPGQGTGVPLNQHITATCSGTNWSLDPYEATASKTLTIELQ